MIEQLQALSLPTQVVFLVCAAAVVYVIFTVLLAVLSFVLSSVVKGARSIIPAGRTPKAAPTASAASAPGFVTPAKPSAPPGVSLKSLIKSQRKGNGGGGADHHADSELFIATLRGHTDAVTGVAFSADGKALATACEDRTVRVYNTSDPFAKMLPFRHHALRKGVQDVAFGASVDHVAVLTQGSANAAGLCMVNMAPKEPFLLWEVEPLFLGMAQTGLCLRGSATSGAAGAAPVLVAASPTPELRVFSASERGEQLGRIDTGGMTNYGAAVSRDGRYVAAATFTSDVKIYEVEYDRLGSFVGMKKVMDLQGHRGKVLAVDFSTDGKKAVTASADGTLIVWNIDVRYKQQEDPKKLLTAGLPLPKGLYYSRLAWGPGGHIAAVHGSSVHLLDVRSGEQVEAIREAHSADIADVAWAPVRMEGPQGKVAVLVTAGRDGRVRLWRGPWLAV